MPRVRVTYKIEQELDRKVKDIAAQSVLDRKKITQSEIVETAIREYLGKTDKGRG